ncbi:hypothetical protein DAMA08_042140 [Martiniozyma asiatica (nom. inval.)]|nr:hypothetical protein DAMA08_042140 [Martiniozyma asiatica]
MTLPKDLSHLISEEAKLRKRSPLEEINKYFTDPDIVYLGGGLPMSSYFPWDNIHATSPSAPFIDGVTSKGNLKTEIAHHEIEEYDIPLNVSLQYGAAAGNYKLIQFLKEHVEIMHKPKYQNWGVNLTIGNTQAWNSVLRTFCDPGDVILFEEFAYPTAIETARSQKLRIEPMAIDEHGIIPEKLEMQLKNWPSDLPMAKILYTVCTGQNPTGSSLPIERRKAIYNLASKYDFLVVEDEPYYFLQLDEYSTDSTSTSIATQTESEFINSLIPSFLSLDVEGRVIRMDSFSKLLAPGVRLGWMIAQPHVLTLIDRLNETSSSTPSGFTQSLVQGLLGRWGQSGYTEWLMALKREYTFKRDFTIKTLEKCVPKEVVSFTPPIAGMFFTVFVDASKHPQWESKFGKDKSKVERDLYEKTLKNGCLLVPGSWFKAPNFKETESTKFFYRGTYAATALDEVKLGLERFGEVVREEFNL